MTDVEAPPFAIPLEYGMEQAVVDSDLEISEESFESTEFVESDPNIDESEGSNEALYLRDYMDDSTDREVLIREVARRVAIRKDVPLIPLIFNNSDKCDEFVTKSMKSQPPPTFGMLEAAAKLFQDGEYAGMAITDMAECKQYLLSKGLGKAPSAEQISTAIRIARWTNTELDESILKNKIALEEWLNENS